MTTIDPTRPSSSASRVISTVTVAVEEGDPTTPTLPGTMPGTTGAGLGTTAPTPDPTSEKKSLSSEVAVSSSGRSNTGGSNTDGSGQSGSDQAGSEAENRPEGTSCGSPPGKGAGAGPDGVSLVAASEEPPGRPAAGSAGKSAEKSSMLIGLGSLVLGFSWCHACSWERPRPTTEPGPTTRTPSYRKTLPNHTWGLHLVHYSLFSHKKAWQRYEKWARERSNRSAYAVCTVCRAQECLPSPAGAEHTTESSFAFPRFLADAAKRRDDPGAFILHRNGSSAKGIQCSHPRPVLQAPL